MSILSLARLETVQSQVEKFLVIFDSEDWGEILPDCVGCVSLNPGGEHLIGGVIPRIRQHLR